MTGARILSIVLFAVLIAFSNASPTFAAGGVCTAPAGNEGDLIYNDDYDIVQYCAGSNIWIKLGGGTVDARIGTLQNSKWCATNASGVIQCDQNAPSSTSAAGSTGQIQFNGGSNAFAADANLFWDNTNKRLGIGTTTPTDRLTVVGNATVSGALSTGGNIDMGGNLRNGSYNLLGMSGNELQLGVGNINDIRIMTNFYGNGNFQITPTGGSNVIRGWQNDPGLGNNYGTLVIGGGTNTDRHIEFGIASSNGNNWIQSWKDGGTVGNLILNATGGNVGIASTNPGRTLEVSGTGLRSTASAGYQSIVANKSSTYSSESSAGIAIDDGTADTGLLLGADAANDVAYVQSLDPATSYTTRPLSLNPNGGNVGIGTTTPTGAKVVNTGAYASYGAATALVNGGTSVVLDYSGGGRLFTQSAVPLTFLTNNAARMTIDATGLVGIGMTSPSAWLDVFGAGTGNGAANQGGLIFRVQDSNSRPAIAAYGNIDGILPNATASALVVRQVNGTGRSISAAGTINANGADYAEYFTQAVPGSLKKEDLVCLANNGTVEKCSRSGIIIGVVSTKPGFVGNDMVDPAHPEKSALVGLVGQVPLKVTMDSGSIRVGDRITFSARPGYGAKAVASAETVGFALEESSPSKDSIMIFVKPEFWLSAGDARAINALRAERKDTNDSTAAELRELREEIKALKAAIH